MGETDQRSKFTFRDLFKSIFSKEKPTPRPAIPEAKIASVDQIGDLKTQIKILTVEKEVAHTALKLAQRAKESGLLTEGEKQILETRYQNRLDTVNSELSQKKKIVEIQELEATKDNLQENYLRRISQIEERIRELSHQISEQPRTGLPSTLTIPSSLTRKRKGEKDFENLKNEITRAMEKLEQIEVES